MQQMALNYLTTFNDENRNGYINRNSLGKHLIFWAVVVVKKSACLYSFPKDPSSNPAEAYIFFYKILEKTKINKMAH